LHKGVRDCCWHMVCASSGHPGWAAYGSAWWWRMLTIAKLSRWSIDYYNRTARAAGGAARDAQRANGGLGEYYSEHDTRAPVWLCAGDVHAAAQLVGLGGAQRAGGAADPDVVARWPTTEPRPTRRAGAPSPDARCTAST
jgi:hypothetical protein